jgi:hypothetical protein
VPSYALEPPPVAERARFSQAKSVQAINQLLSTGECAGFKTTDILLKAPDRCCPSECCSDRGGNTG